jgi:tetratricopeptide (TPR) repeat protein
VPAIYGSGVRPIDRFDFKKNIIEKEKYSMRVFLPVLIIAMLAISACNTAYQTTDVEGPTSVELNAEQQEELNYNMKVARSYAHEYFKQRDYVTAKGYFLELFAMDAKNKYAQDLKRLSDCYKYTNDPDSARIVLERAIELRPDEWYEQRSLAILLSSMDEKETAFRQYQICVTLKDDDFDSHLDIMNYYKDAARNTDSIEDWDKVLASLEILIALKPEDKRWSTEKDKILAANYDEEVIIESLRNSHQQFPDDLKITRKLARSLVEFNSPEAYTEALPLLQILQAADPDKVDYYELKVSALGGLNRTNEAAETLIELFSKRADKREYPARIAQLYLEMGQLKTARKWALRTKRDFKDYGRGYILMANIYIAAVSECTGSELDFDDKLVYEKASKEYDKVRDPAYKSEARNGKDSLKEVLPNAEDRFFNKYDEPRKDCYQWLLK